MGRRQGIVHPAQVCRHGRLAREHAVKQRAQAIDIGVFSVKFRHGVLLRRSITVEHLALQLAVRGAQAQRGIARKLGRARFGDEHRLGADAPVQQAHAVHGLHAIDHRAQQQKRLALRQRLGPLLQISEQRRALVRLAHSVSGIVFLNQVQHLHQAVVAPQRDKAAVQVHKIHARRLEQHLAALARYDAAVAGTRGADGDGHIFLDNHAARGAVVYGSVQNALAVQRQHTADGIAPGQQRVDGQRAGGIGILKALPAVRARGQARIRVGQAVAANDLFAHGLYPLSVPAHVARHQRSRSSSFSRLCHTFCTSSSSSRWSRRMPIFFRSSGSDRAV